MSIGGNRAIDLIIAKESGLTGRRFGASESAPARVLGEHPSGGPVTIKAGRYGPYVSHGKVNATLLKDADPTTLTLEGALELLSAKASGGGGPIQGRLLGEHPSGGPITVRAGRFGAYVNHGKTNATLKANASAETITLEEAIRLIEDKEAAGGGAKKKAAAPKKTAAKAAPKTNGAKAGASKAAASKAKASEGDDDGPPFEPTANLKPAPARKPAGSQKPAPKPAADKQKKAKHA
ncbi:DNA topoisomerase 1 (fragment) [Methylocella tundrae]|uniref:DNA topoisomerase 1 n=1 Tax=Methylocella tundrae TaxID=227605 RepID=A0A4U8Z729_METTU